MASIIDKVKNIFKPAPKPSPIQYSTPADNNQKTSLPSGTAIGSSVTGGTIVTSPTGNKVIPQTPGYAPNLPTSSGGGGKKGGGGSSSGSSFGGNQLAQTTQQNITADKSEVQRQNNLSNQFKNQKSISSVDRSSQTDYNRSFGNKLKSSFQASTNVGIIGPQGFDKYREGIIAPFKSTQKNPDEVRRINRQLNQYDSGTKVTTMSGKYIEDTNLAEFNFLSDVYSGESIKTAGGPVNYKLDMAASDINKNLNKKYQGKIDSGEIKYETEEDKNLLNTQFSNEFDTEYNLLVGKINAGRTRSDKFIEKNPADTFLKGVEVAGTTAAFATPVGAGLVGSYYLGSSTKNFATGALNKNLTAKERAGEFGKGFLKVGVGTLGVNQAAVGLGKQIDMARLGTLNNQPMKFANVQTDKAGNLPNSFTLGTKRSAEGMSAEYKIVGLNKISPGATDKAGTVRFQGIQQVEVKPFQTYLSMGTNKPVFISGTELKEVGFKGVSFAGEKLKDSYAIYGQGTSKSLGFGSLVQTPKRAILTSNAKIGSTVDEGVFIGSSQKINYKDMSSFRIDVGAEEIYKGYGGKITTSLNPLSRNVKITSYGYSKLVTQKDTNFIIGSGQSSSNSLVSSYKGGSNVAQSQVAKSLFKDVAQGSKLDIGLKQSTNNYGFSSVLTKNNRPRQETFQITRQSRATLTGLSMNQIIKEDQKVVSIGKLSNNQITISRSSQRPRQGNDLITGQITELTTKQKSASRLTPRDPSSFNPFKPNYPAPRIPIGFKLPSFNLFDYENKRGKRQKIPRQSNYAPNLASIGLNIRSNAIPTSYKKGYGSLAIRPLIINKRKKKK